MSALDIPLSLRLPRATARKLDAAGMRTVGDLLSLPPRRYDHWGALTRMSGLREGEDVTLLAEVVSQRLIPNRSRAGVRLEVTLTDGADQMAATFFAHSEYRLAPHRRLLVPGSTFLFAGRVGSFRGSLQLTHPQFEGAEDESEDDIRRRQERPIPIYPGGSGLTSWVIARAVAMVLDQLDDADVPDPVPEEVRTRRDVLPRAEALRLLHAPSSDLDHRRARQSLAFEEAFVLEAGLLAARAGVSGERAPACPVSGNAVLEALLGHLPFTLTEAQRSALAEIQEDLSLTRPMQRLLQGDVGSGKTVVALAAMCQVVGAGHQAALLAPTGILAQQHAESLRRLLEPVRQAGREVPLRVLTGASGARARREVDEVVRGTDPAIVVGTHALLQDTVRFADLGLVVVDEQHRFGVAQRDRLRRPSGADGDSRRVAHQLVMTATPIPRTVAMTVFGDLDETRMTGLPPGRTPVRTYLVDAANAAWMDRVWARAREEVASGGRVYVVCPRIDEDDAVADADAEAPGGSRPPLASVAAVAQSLRASTPLAGLGIQELHGKMPQARKTQVMEDFTSGRAPVVVATTVVEVGVDVPEASLMVILDAQQFGLSQLHQLRGRVGRSERESVCLAVHRHEAGAATMERLRAFEGTADGFELANEDLRLRREGDVLGADQSGRTSGLRFLSVQRDEALIRVAREEAADAVARDPRLAGHPDLAASVRARSGSDLVWMERS
ncbi:MAG: ATP-dependent DNA helicase RecG [Actinomyces sp.]|jgi:ATP-dependent DNA helicase RecG|nr:ATP-dependent DNA helicase RecG [Actinomyces sp.]MCI1641299.1 ATP-dependent DNA helicase RecG [Actinomyces sp.]MCI1662118.1 ATP-dependent DNA helicase RecG [Actinomyces sp.]MCI1690899.1 ATP-dependent DNA helicase RecG [Actinomyces sp.]MCI1786920.1 ATP-dependent DNA helicase RecG [Actinomyces sp.]MCI1828938.1 ATP-dependent DNA helicase RecG [Actinomyces sp.]